ncbi:ABC transporter ATP-binding protein [Actinoplanes sp. SE50]|uniref:ABC transporter ATP-binding protein n=1 Tax=unclassified Actinoplanes TaxID=2626549 RepID=UPI00023EC6A7|nr:MULTISPECIES: ABC transporter ATP-binding protein [unclassified Actinoplanes]AEV86448.1 Lipid A export ATP-binding/permease protein msbA [Actinoplanes sp. SE50/110]ATO84846.1 ABC transporter ATP-binding protein [Actinoplanes sp. SE50]SLM02255.1 ABC transporter ATP-binding protein [Actinoplanes sp. SE50/110]
MSMFGGGFGGPGHAIPGRHGSGTPFAGIPPELAAGVARLEAAEPPLPAPDEPFHQQPDTRRLTLWSLLANRPGLLVTAALAVLAEALLLQAGPLLVQIGIDHGIVARDVPVLVVSALAFVAAVALTAVASGVRIRQSGRLAAYVTRDLRVRVFAHLQRLSLDFYTREKAGVTMTRMTSDVEALQQLLQEGFAQFLIQGLTMIVVTVVLVHYDAELALITLLLVVPPLAALSIWFRRAADLGYRRQRDAIAALFSHLSESLYGVRVITAHNRQQRSVVEHREVVGAYRDANDHTGRINAVYGPGSSVIGLLGLAALLAIGGRRVLRGELTIGELTAFVLYINAFFQPVQQLVQLYTNYQQARAALGKLRGLLGTVTGVPESIDARQLPPATGGIEFRGVSFGYVPDRPVLRDVTLRIAPGETIACVGPTGAGKSTLAKLVARLYDPDRGAILIDGHDLREVTLDSLHRQVGVVPQEPFLFAGSLRDNIAFARPDAADAEVDAAVDAVGLRDLVDRSPDGLHTVLHERGQSVSSGERQLIALARVFVAAPRIIVLDEATSSLDLRSELRVEAAVQRLLQGRTAILVAHRLSTARRADRVIVVDDGGILESGSHDELIAAGGRYASMFATWESHAAA